MHCSMMDMEVKTVWMLRTHFGQIVLLRQAQLWVWWYILALRQEV
jgi:hypothetical protein